MSFYDDFLTELKAVDDFLARRTGDPSSVTREDPDVRRLMESIAFFSARTRQAASDQVRSSVMSLVRGHLDDFLSPQPARGLVQATPTDLVTDTAHLPAGTMLRVTTADGDLGLFATMTDVTLRPLQIDLAELGLRPGGGFRIALRVRARREVIDMPEPLAIHLSYLGDYHASLRFQYRLRRHLLADGVSVFYDTAPDPTRAGAPCAVRFGSAPPAQAAPGADSPIERLRTFLHFPAKELALGVALPRPAAPWRQAWVCFDLDDDWPAELVVNKDVFRLFVLPVENLVREGAMPIKCDGTRAHYPITPGRIDAQLALHSVAGVFQELPSRLDPILPVQLASGDESYDVEYVAEAAGGLEPRLVLRLPAAFLTPRLVSVEARWYQPDFDRLAVGKLDVRLQTRHLQGVELRLLGTLVPHRESALWRDPAAMMQVLSRRVSRVLGRRDLIGLMTQLGADDDSYHAGVDADLLHIEAREEPAELGRGGGIRHVYQITIDNVDDDRLGLIADYLRCVETLLDAWSASPVRLEVHRRTAGARALPMLAGGA
ncbi:MAG TPA: type VI secretion system baseplate subunit TssF [Kofleriaceae bacterium]|nr:type VI secretion system baseplate subunit TssF [Kofleriaceae bacterium]